MGRAGGRWEELGGMEGGNKEISVFNMQMGPQPGSGTGNCDRLGIHSV